MDDEKELEDGEFKESEEIDLDHVEEDLDMGEEVDSKENWG